ARLPRDAAPPLAPGDPALLRAVARADAPGLGPRRGGLGLRHAARCAPASPPARRAAGAALPRAAPAPRRSRLRPGDGDGRAPRADPRGVLVRRRGHRHAGARAGAPAPAVLAPDGPLQRGRAVHTALDLDPRRARRARDPD